MNVQLVIEDLTNAIPRGLSMITHGMEAPDYDEVVEELYIDAVKRGDLAKVIKYGWNVDSIIDAEDTSALLAVKSGNVKLAKRFIEQLIAIVDEEDEDVMIDLLPNIYQLYEHACMSGNVHMVRYINRIHKDIYASTNQDLLEVGIVNLTCSYGDDRMLDYIFNETGIANYVRSYINLDDAFTIACRNNGLSMALLLLDYAIVNNPYTYHNYLQACRGGDLGLVEHLVDHGSVGNEHSSDPYIAAIKSGNVSLVKYLVRSGLAHSSDQVRTKAHLAAYRSGKIEMIKYITKKGVDSVPAYQLLIKAIKSGSIEAVHYLYYHDLVDDYDLHGDSDQPIKLALKLDNIEIAFYLYNLFGFDRRYVRMASIPRQIDLLLKHKQWVDMKRMIKSARK